jgi:ABC-type glutathione transport system ATPase component
MSAHETAGGVAARGAKPAHFRLGAGEATLEVLHLKKEFHVRRRLREVARGERVSVKAVDDVSFQLKRGENRAAARRRPASSS